MGVEDKTGAHNDELTRVDPTLLPSTWELIHQYMEKYPAAKPWAIASFYLQLSRYSERLARGDFNHLQLPRSAVAELQARRTKPTMKQGGR